MTPPNRVTAVIAGSAVVAALAVCTLLSLQLTGYYRSSFPLGTPLQWWTVALWALFALALVVVRWVPRRAAIALILVGSAAIGGAAMSSTPNTSTDSARYAWDGIVQDAGISPYADVPTSPQLESLRPAWLFPDTVTRDDGTLHCSGARIMRFVEPLTGEIVCTAINRANDPTIYPPTAEIVFAAVRLVVGPDAEYWPLQLVGLLASLAITVVLLVALTGRGRNPRWAAMWAWCPLVATEAITNSHVDVIGSLLLLLATLAVASRRRWLGGIALGASIATKLIPVLGAPALLGERRSWRVVVGAIATFALLYVPYVIAEGPKVIGFLPGYLSEEGFASGDRSILFSSIAPGFGATALSALAVAIAAVLVWRHVDPRTPWMGEVIVIGVALLAFSPRYAWYGLLLVPMIAMTGRWEWLVVPLALTERLLYAPIWPGRATMTIAVVILVIVSARRAGQGSIAGLFRDPGRIWRRPIRSGHE